MTIELPAHPDTTFEEGNVKFDMPNFSLKFGMLKDAHFQRLEVQTTDKPIVAEVRFHTSELLAPNLSTKCVATI